MSLNATGEQKSNTTFISDRNKEVILDFISNEEESCQENIQLNNNSESCKENLPPAEESGIQILRDELKAFEAYGNRE